MHRVSTRLLVLSLTCLLFFSFTTKARDTNLIFGSKVFFFQTDSVQLKRDFKTNRRVFDALDFLLNMPEVYNHIDSVLVVGAASPIGSGEHNYALSIARAKAMEVYIMWKHPDFDRSRIAEKAAGIDWEGFRYLVTHDSRVPDKGKILLLLNNTRNEDLLLRELRGLPPETQKYLKANIFSRLQYVCVRFKMDDGSYIPAPEGSPLGDFLKDGKDFKDVKDFKDFKETVECDTVFIRDTIVQTVHPVFPEKNRTHPVFAVSSNLLYAAALLPNLSFEAAFGRHCSLLLQGAWTWLDTRSPDYWSYRIQMLWLESRYWWGERPEALTGFFTGVYGAVGTYDIRLFPKGGEPWGSLSNFSYSLGITGGYSKPLSQRWNLNFNLGIGWLGGEYNEYNHSSCADCYPKRSTKQRRYFGPTQVAVSIVYLISNEK